MQHKITTADILHHKVDSSFRLEACMEVGQERMTFPVSNQEDTLLGTNAFHLIVFNNEFLLEDLDCIKLSRSLRLGKHDLAEVTLTQNS